MKRKHSKPSGGMIMKAAKRHHRDILSELLRSGASPYDFNKYAEMLAAQSHNQIDVGYIKTILFPELYNFDIPQPMSTQSYTRFTDKKEITLKSGTGVGSGMLIWYPKCNIGPQLFLRRGTASSQLSNAIPFTINSATGWLAGGDQDYSSFFSQTCLVSASLSIQYTGQLQNEQGFMVGSQIYGISPSAVTSNDIENGQFKVTAKPGDGLRVVYCPKDTNDFIYYPCTYNKPATGAFTLRTRNGGRNPETDLVTYTLSGNQADYMDGTVPTNWNNRRYQEGNTGSNSATFQLDSTADMIAIYWQGMKPDVEGDLRLDLVRKFNGFPLATQRDVLDLIKPKKVFDPKKTIDVINELQMNVPQICGHSLKQMDRVSDQIQEFLPNLGALYNEGMLRDGTSLEGFATQLQGISGMGGGQAVSSEVGRIYDA